MLPAEFGSPQNLPNILKSSLGIVKAIFPAPDHGAALRRNPSGFLLPGRRR